MFPDGWVGGTRNAKNPAGNAGLLIHGAEGRTRTGTDRSTRPSTVRVYQFRHFGMRYCHLRFRPLFPQTA